MAYYNKNYRHRRKNNKGYTKSRANVYISTKYKGITPTFAEFGISESDIEIVKREYEEWYCQQKFANSRLRVADQAAF